MTLSTTSVTGVTAATGSSAITNLIASRQKVSAFVHSHDARAAAMLESGVQVIIGDLLDMNSLRAALENVSADYSNASREEKT